MAAESLTPADQSESETRPTVTTQTSGEAVQFEKPSDLEIPSAEMAPLETGDSAETRQLETLPEGAEVEIAAELPAFMEIEAELQTVAVPCHGMTQTPSDAVLLETAGSDIAGEIAADSVQMETFESTEPPVEAAMGFERTGDAVFVETSTRADVATEMVLEGIELDCRTAGARC
jgi:hypothetical protein